MRPEVIVRLPRESLGHGAAGLDMVPRGSHVSRVSAFPPFCVRFLLLGLLATTAARAVIPEPDNVIYGTITLNNQVVTAARTDVVVEARRLINGPAVSSYRMGSDPRFGNFYSLRLSLESLLPITDADAAQVGDTLFIVVTDASGVRAQNTYTLSGRGAVQRVDFGTAVSDSDGDGLPDAWETLHFSGLGQGPGAINPNGQTTLQNYIAGTNPNDTNSLFRVSVAINGATTVVSWQALRAEGTGYEGRSRSYDLEVAAPLGAGWQSVPGFTNLPGNNQTISYGIPGTNSPAFYRARVSLQ